LSTHQEANCSYPSMADLDYKREEDSSSPSKRLKISSVKENIRASDYGCELLFSELIQGGFELITLQEAIGQDGYLNKIREDIRNNGPLSKKLGLVKIMSRCISKDNDNILYNVRSSGKQGTNDRYPRCCIVRMVNASTHLTRKSCLDEIARFLNEAYVAPNRNHKVAFDMHAKRKAANIAKYLVPPNFGLTQPGSTPRKMDHVLVSRSIVELIKTAYTNVTPTWAAENPQLATEFFDPPYPVICQTELGYPNKNISSPSD
jgi:hypothetical protein